MPWILCLVILFGRMLDVTLSTIRTIMTVRSKPLVASCIGFIEVFLWFMIVREALNTDSDSIFIALSYALGYAIGTFLGGMIVKLFIRGKVTLQVVTLQNQELLNELRNRGYAVTAVEAHGAIKSIKKHLLFIEADSKYAKDIRNIINEFDNKAFITVHETKGVYNGYFK